MVESLGDLIVSAYNANEKRNYYKVRKNLKLAIKMLDTLTGKLNQMTNNLDKLDNIVEDQTHV